MYVCMHVCMYICMYVCCMYVHMCVSTVFWEIFEVKYFRCFCGFACSLKILTARKTLVSLLSMITRWPSSKIYSRKGPILENFVPRKFPNMWYMYVCMYLCKYVRMYVCMCVCVHVCIYVCT